MCEQPTCLSAHAQGTFQYTRPAFELGHRVHDLRGRCSWNTCGPPNRVSGFHRDSPISEPLFSPPPSLQISGREDSSKGDAQKPCSCCVNHYVCTDHVHVVPPHSTFISLFGTMIPFLGSFCLSTSSSSLSLHSGGGGLHLGTCCEEQCMP